MIGHFGPVYVTFKVDYAVQFKSLPFGLFCFRVVTSTSFYSNMLLLKLNLGYVGIFWRFLTTALLLDDGNHDKKYSYNSFVEFY